MTEHCPTCGGIVRVKTSDEGTSSYLPVDPHRLNMLINTQQMARQIDDVIVTGGCGGDVLNAIAEMLRQS